MLKSQISVTYQPNGTDAAKTAYIKNLGWHFARYNNTPYKDDPIYCIEPCKDYAASTSGNYMDQDLGVSGSGSSRGSNVWYAMPSSYRQAIALTLLYSKQLWNSNYSVKTTAMANNPNVSTRIATQFLIYEIVTGLRDADTFSRKNSNGYTSGDVFYNAGVANVSGFADKYNSIVSSVQSAMKIPSFTNRSSGSAPTLTMSGSQVSVTDSNGVLGNFSFTNGNGASFSKSGNTLTITKTGTISPSTVFSATRSLPSVENSTVSIYYSASSTYQTCVKLYSPQVETLRAYFKINAPNPGAIALVKTTEDGQNLSGWRFALYSNAACTTLVSGPHTTDSSGKISITGLNAGTYYVKELGHSDSSISSRYTCSGDNPQKVTVSNGATTSVSFYNKLAVGALAIRKSTNTGNHLGGWKFIVKKDGAEIPGSPFTTNETGIIRISNLAPGKYVILESPTDDPYWTAELGYHTVTVEYGKTAVDQWLNKEQGLGCFTKSTNTGDEISGWHITVYADEACTQELHTLITGQDGTACIYLEPGTYWVKETGSEDVRDDYWKMDDSVKQLVIRAHDKTTLEFVNNYSGRIAIRKSVEPEGTLEGWKFRITDADGKEVSGSPFTTDKDVVNVQSLEAVQPVDLTAGEITVRLGAAWLPPDVIQNFMFELLRTPYIHNTSFVILDPKGELLRDTGHLLEEKGYVIKVLDLINPERSHCYNPFKKFYGDIAEYMIDVRAVPMLNGIPTIYQAPISNLTADDVYASNYQMSSIQIQFSPNGQLIYFSMDSPVDIEETINSNVAVIPTDELLDLAKTNLMLSTFSQYDIGAQISPSSQNIICKVTISKVTYALARIRKPNTDTSYYYIPALTIYGDAGFYNKATGDFYFSNDDLTLLSLNAVDGSIVNSTNS